MMPSHRFFVPAGLVFVVALCTVACGDRETAAQAQPETDSSLCTRICKQLPTVCPRFLQDLDGDCHASCMTPEDSSTEFRRCLANSASCDDMSACKDAY